MPKPADASRFEWALNAEQKREEGLVTAGRYTDGLAAAAVSELVSEVHIETKCVKVTFGL